MKAVLLKQHLKCAKLREEKQADQNIDFESFLLYNFINTSLKTTLKNTWNVQDFTLIIFL